MAAAHETQELQLVSDEEAANNIPEYTVAELESLDLDRRVTLLHLSHQIGTLLGSRLLGNFEEIERGMTLKRSDLERIEKPSIEAGLYISPDDERYIPEEKQDKASQNAMSGLVTIRSKQGVEVAEQSGLVLPFNVGLKGQPGVVFPPDEYPKVARSPKDLAEAVMVKQRAKLWEQNSKLPREKKMPNDEIEEAVKAKARGVLRSLVDGTKKLELEYDNDQALLLRLYRQTLGLRDGETKTPQNQYKARNLAEDIRTADAMFRETLEVSAIYNNWDEKDVRGAHRALTRVLYRGSPRENGFAWRYHTHVQDAYINARRFKLIQARIRCEQEIARHPKKKEENTEVKA